MGNLWKGIGYFRLYVWPGDVSSKGKTRDNRKEKENKRRVSIFISTLLHEMTSVYSETLFFCGMRY